MDTEILCRLLLYAHEKIHSDQWAEFGPDFGALYLAFGLFFGGCNPFEQEAGFWIGHYDCPQVSTWREGPP